VPFHCFLDFLKLLEKDRLPLGEDVERPAQLFKSLR
jgi:hypothetical protein